MTVQSGQSNAQSEVGRTALLESGAPLEAIHSPRLDLDDASLDRQAAWCHPWRFALILGLLVLAAFPDVVFSGKTFAFRDYSLFGYPLAHYHRESFWSGEIPLWNPLSNCGLPFLAQWNTMVLYPLSLVYLLLPMPWALGWFCLLHLFLAGLGMYLLAWRWTGHPLASAVAGIAFAFNGLTLSCLIWPNNIAALAWMPWVLRLTEQAWGKGGRALATAALIGALQLFAGAPEIFLFTWLVLLGIWIGQMIPRSAPRRRMLLRAGIVVALVAGLTAAQSFPFLDLLKHSQRDVGYGGAEWSMPPWGWANFLVPLFRCEQTSAGVFVQEGQAWASSYYLGIGLFGLALLALIQARERRVWILGAMFALSLVLALGEAGYLFELVRRVVPQVGFVRFPVKLVVITACLGTLLASFAVRSLTLSDSAQLCRLRRPANMLLATLLALIAVIVWLSYRYPAEDEQWAATFWSGATRALFLFATATVLQALTKARDARRLPWLQGGLLLLIWADVMTHAPRQNPTVDANAYRLALPPLEELNPLPRLGASRAMLSRRAIDKFHTTIVSNTFDGVIGNRLGLYDNLNLLEGIPKIDGFFSLYFPEEQQVRFRLYASTNAIPGRLGDFLGVSQVTAESSFFDWAHRPTWQPLLTAGQKPEFLDPAATLEALARADFNPRQTVFLPPAARDSVAVTGACDVTLRPERIAAHRITAEIESPQAAIVVIAQAFYHPWKARVDGARVPLWRANHAFQALQVPAGRHRLELAYEDRNFRAGALISLLSLVAVLLLRFLGRRGGDDGHAGV